MSTGMYGNAGGGAGQAIFTDDVSLQVFMEHLKRLVSLLALQLYLHSSAYNGRRLWVLRRTEIEELFSCTMPQP